MSQSRVANDSVSEKSEPSIASSDSLQTVREASKTSFEEIPFADESIAKKNELARERYLNESAAAAERRGELFKRYLEVRRHLNLILIEFHDFFWRFESLNFKGFLSPQIRFTSTK